MLGEGWFRGRMGFGGAKPAIYGDRIALIAQLEVEYADGTAEYLTTDETWRASRGPILANDIYDGEEYDARLEPPGGSGPDFDDSAWAGVKAVPWDFATLFAPLGPPVRRIELVAPQRIFLSPSGKTLVDFGQNLVGRLRLTVRGPAGQTITLRHAEVLEHGELGTRPLRHAKATDRYTLRGSDGAPVPAAPLPSVPVLTAPVLTGETWEPRFTFHGFRYAEVEGWPGELQPDDIQAVVCHSDMERTGWFGCSEPLINRLHENAVWSMRGNFLDVPTDCPQRDERLGWTGDIQVFSPTATFLYDASGFLSSWLADLAADQTPEGIVPFFVPDITGGKVRPAAAWGDAAVVVPWVLYQRFGDTQILADQFDSMVARVDLLERIAGERRLWDTGFQFGDWLDPAAPPDNPAGARTPALIVASAYFACSAEILGRSRGCSDAKQRRPITCTRRGGARGARPGVRDSRRARPQRRVDSLRPGPRLCAPTRSPAARHAAERLVELVRAEDYRISTGFVGTPLMCDCAAPGTWTWPTACPRSVPALVALPGDDGGHHDLGALGQHVARRLDQSR